MYVMTGKLTFPAWQDTEGKPMVIRKFTAVHIDQTFKQITQFAEITMPRNVKTFDKNNVREIFRKGDPVIIELGYDGNDVEEFRGYIDRVSSDIPIVIRVEDEMYKARKIPVNYTAKNISLPNLLKKIAPGYEIDALDVKLGDVRYSKKLLGDVLEDIKSKLKLHTYFIGKKLVCGKYYTEKSGSNIPLFDLERNTVNNSLNYKNKEDVVVKIDAHSITADGKKVTFSLGEVGGDHLKLQYYNVKVKAELEKKVRLDYERATRGGFTGSFTAFGKPRVSFGEKCNLQSAVYPDRNGQYYVEGTVIDFNDQGFRREIKLGGSAKLEGNE
ncbi:hypothetical protein D3C72_535480 [compost metagenome]